MENKTGNASEEKTVTALLKALKTLQDDTVVLSVSRSGEQDLQKQVDKNIDKAIKLLKKTLDILTVEY